MERKKLVIQNNKTKIDELLKQCNDNYCINLDNCQKLLEEHTEFIKIIRSINIFEIYKWKHLINEYKLLKCKINKDNKIISEIATIYGNTITYYTNEQSENINESIHTYEKLREHIITNFTFLRHEHLHLSNFIKNIKKKDNYILIENEDEDIKNIVKQLYDINNKIKEINKKSGIVKRRKAFYIMKYNMS